MKNPTNNMSDLEKKGASEITNIESRSGDATINTSSNTNISKPSADVTASAKKDINYIFQLNVTKKKLETILKKIDKLANKTQEIDNILQEKYGMVAFHQEQIYLTDMEYQKQLSVLHQNMKLYKIPDLKPITDLDVRDIFLDKHEAVYLEKNILPMLKFSSEKDPQKLEDTKDNLLYQERQRMDQFLEQLHAAYLNIVVEKETLDEKQKKFNVLKKEIADLQAEFTDIQESIIEEQEKYNEVNMHGLLKAYEVSGTKISINDFIVHPTIELQMKKLISIFNNQSEAKKFGLSLPKGIIFVGEPETGKTFAAKVLASEIDRKMYHIKAHDLFSENSTDPNQMLYIIFYSIIDHVQKNKESCIIFLDEIEKIIDSVGEYNPAEQKMISNTILKNIINIQKSNLDIVVLAALGKMNKIDPRFMKYDIFDNQFFFDLPGTDERKRLFQLYFQKAEERAKTKLFDPNIIDDLVKKTEGFSAEYVKQLINSCVKEYLYSYLNQKSSFDIDQTYIGTALEEMKKQRLTSPSKKKMLVREDRQKIVRSFMLKHIIFGRMDTNEKSQALQTYILDNTERYTETDLNKLMELCNGEYQKRKSEYHKQSLIQKDFILEKIQELRSEDKRKGNSSYFSHQ